MRPRLRAELEATIDHIRRAQLSDEFVADLDATLEWLEEARDTLLSCRDEGMSDPAASIYALRELRRKLPLRPHGSSRNEDRGMDHITDRVVPGILDEEGHLSRGQPTPKRADHEPRKTAITGGKSRESASERGRRNAELIELERYRGETTDARLEMVGGVLEGEGSECGHENVSVSSRIHFPPQIVNKVKANSLKLSFEGLMGSTLRRIARLRFEQLYRLNIWLDHASF